MEGQTMASTKKEALLTEEQAIALIHEAGRDMGLDPSAWRITFDHEGQGAVVQDDDPVKAHIRVTPLQGHWDETNFRFIALHEVGHIKAQHPRRFSRYRVLGSCLIGAATLAVSLADTTALLSSWGWKSTAAALEASWALSILSKLAMVGASAVLVRRLLMRRANWFEHEANLLALDRLVEHGRLDVIADRSCLHAKMFSLRDRCSPPHSSWEEELQVMINYLREKKGMSLDVQIKDDPDNNSRIVIKVTIDGQVLDTNRKQQREQ